MKFKNQLLLSNVITFVKKGPFNLSSQDKDILSYKVVGVPGLLKLPKIYFPVVTKVDKSKLPAVEPNFGEKRSEKEQSCIPVVKQRKVDKSTRFKRRAKLRISAD